VSAITALELRAKTALSNLDEVTPAMLEQALSEALELTDNKPIPQVMLVDLAMFRLMLSVKAIPTEMDERLANAAISRAQKTKDVADSATSAPFVKYGNRSSEWTL
jgi:hypothetical protein